MCWITIRCTRNRGPRGFFCLQDVRRGPVNVAVIGLSQSEFRQYSELNREWNVLPHRWMESLMSYLDLIAVATAIIALWYAGYESRRNNRVVLRIRDFESSGTQAVDKNNGKFFHVLKLVIENRGISLHNIHASIGFQPSDNGDGGWFNFPLKRRALSGDRDEFARGMIAEFKLKSYEFKEHDFAFLKMIEDPTLQNAKFCIYSQDYLAHEFQIGGWVERKIKAPWNRFAQWFNDLFTTKIGKNPEGCDVIRQRKILPIFLTLEWKLQNFVKSIARDEQAQGQAA